MIMNTGHLLKYIAIAAPNLIECAQTSSFLIPSLASPIAPTMSRSVSIRWSNVTCAMIPWLKTDEMGEFWEVPGYFLFFLQLLLQIKRGREIFLRPFDLSFFCLSKVIETQFAYSNSGSSWLIRLLKRIRWFGVWQFPFFWAPVDVPVGSHKI